MPRGGFRPKSKAGLGRGEMMKKPAAAQIRAELIGGNLNTQAIAKKFGVPHYRVYNVISRLRQKGLNIPMRKRQPVPESGAGLIRAALSAGMPAPVAKEVLGQYGVAPYRIYDVVRQLRRKGVPLPPYQWPESTASKVRVEVHGGNFDAKGIAKKHGTSAIYVREIFRKLRRQGVIFPAKPKPAKIPEQKAAVTIRDAHRMVEAAVKAGREDRLERALLLRAGTKWISARYSKYCVELKKFDRQYGGGSWKRNEELIKRRNSMVTMRDAFGSLLKKSAAK